MASITTRQSHGFLPQVGPSNPPSPYLLLVITVDSLLPKGHHYFSSKNGYRRLVPELRMSQPLISLVFAQKSTQKRRKRVKVLVDFNAFTHGGEWRTRPLASGPGRGSDMPPACHSLPRRRYRYPLGKGDKFPFQLLG